MRKRVLIVDDNSANLYMLKSLMEEEGVEVSEAENGKDALNKARLNPPDLIVSDILMPVMDGFTLCREWKSDDELKHIPFVFYTATYTEPKDEAFALRLGAERFIIKPQEPDIFMNMLKEVLEQKYTVSQAANKPLGEEMEFFRHHNEILFQKLEKKMTDLEIANQKLRISEEMYRLSLKNVSDVIYTIDTDLNIISVSPSVEKILGYKPQDLIGRPISHLENILTPESIEQAVADINLVLKGETIPVTTYRFIAKDGTIKHGEVSGSPVIREGKIIGIVAVVRDITKRKRAEDLYETLAESSLAGVFIVQEGKFVFINTSAIAYAGYNAEELIGCDADMIVHPDDKELVRIKSREMLAGRSNQPFEFRMFTKQNEVRWVSQTLTPIYYQGRPAILGNAMDISDRKQTEEAMRESEEKYRHIFETSRDCIFITSKDGRWIDMNDAAVELFGYSSREELMQVDIRNIYCNPEDRTSHINMIEERGYVKEYPVDLKKKDGTVMNTLITTEGTYDTKGNVIKFQGTIRDVTAQRKLEKVQRETEEKYRSLAEGTDLMCLLNPDGFYMLANERYAQRFGVPTDEIIGRRFADFHSEEDTKEFMRLLKDVINTGVSVQPEYRSQRDGRYFVRTVSPVKDQDGTIKALTVVSKDITDRMQAEEKLQQTLESLRKAIGTTIQVLVSAVEIRDPHTSGHQLRVANLARAIAIEMGLLQEKIDGIRMASSIHDIGKLAIPAEILSKPTKLTEMEFSLIKEHSRKGYEMLKDVESSWPLAEMVYQHHERMDGSGYPRNMKGDDILMEARIMAVADVVEAMASHRPYRPTLGIDVALAEIEKNREIFYDSVVVDACLRLFREKDFKL